MSDDLFKRMTTECPRCGKPQDSIHCTDLDKTARPSKDEWNVMLLSVLKLRASCPRRQGSAIIVDERGVHISTGYNGPPSGLPNCTEDPCEGALDTSGDTSRCIALHAEHNAIKHAAERIRYATTIYCSTRPCMKCALEICDTPIKRVVFVEDYPDARGLSFLSIRGISLERWLPSSKTTENVSAGS